MSLADTAPWGSGFDTNAASSDTAQCAVAITDDNATHSIPSCELQQRTAAFRSGKALAQSGQALSTLFSIFNVTERDVHPDTRVVVCPPVASAELEPMVLPAAAGQEVVVGRQSSGTTDFTLDLGRDRACRFFYDVASDNVIAYNDGYETVHLVALETDAVDDRSGDSAALATEQLRPLSPGYWRIMSDRDGHPSSPLTELLLLRRRFSTRKSLKKMPLPDTTVRGWEFKNNQSKADAWLKSVAGFEVDLREDGIEGIVRRMLAQDYHERPSAHCILDELAAAPEQV